MDGGERLTGGQLLKYGTERKRRREGERDGEREGEKKGRREGERVFTQGLKVIGEKPLDAMYKLLN